MADIFLLTPLTEAVITHAIGRISELLINNAAALSSVRDDVNSLTIELGRIRSFLSSTSHQLGLVRDDRVRTWVAEIRDIACEIEDVVDAFVVKSDSSGPLTPMFFDLRSFRKSIDSTRSKLQSIFDSLRHYGIPIHGDGSGQGDALRKFMNPYEEYDDADNDVVVGQDEAVRALKARVMEERDRLCAIPVVGAAGSGKTAVVKKVYGDFDAMGRFDCMAWVLISRDYVVKDVYVEILFQITESPILAEEIRSRRELLRAMEESELIGMIKENLNGRRFMIVFDDLRTEGDLDLIWRVLPGESRGSKAVFTTQMRIVARAVEPGGGTQPIQPQLLGPEDSWTLLHRKAFTTYGYGERFCSPGLERIGREMVMKCGGLPLAIVALGKALRTKNKEDEWRDVDRSYASSHLGEVLASSYHDLPYYLKPCLLYFGCFPDGLEIQTTQLIQLWIAEGLVVVENARIGTMEEIGKGYLRELVNRGMVLLGSGNHNGDVVETCSVHRVTRYFCVLKSRMDNFCEVISTSRLTDEHLMSALKMRRIAIHPGCDLCLRKTHPNLRSLMYFEATKPSTLGNFLRRKSSRLLRVLEFGFDPSIRSCSVPSEIGKLRLLKYLGLRGSGRVVLPSSIEELQSLTTINLRGYAEVVLPLEIFRLKSLKHLFLPSGSTYPYGFSWMIHTLSDTSRIQTIKYIVFGSFLLKNKLVKSEFNSLRTLGVEFRTKEEVTMFMSSPNFDFGSIECLHMSISRVGFTALESLSRVGFTALGALSQCAVLSELMIDGKLSYDHHDLEFLPNSLAKLTLRGSGISNDPMAVLGRLPNLQFLRLEDAYIGPRIVCGPESFRKLEKLSLLSMDQVTQWEVERNTMPNLKCVFIRDMPNLSIPQELNRNTSLEIIEDELT